LSRRTIIILAIGVIAAGALVIAGVYHYEGRHYVSTDDARVAADLVSISPQLTGSILSWQVNEGDLVKAGQVLGRQDLGTALSSGALSPQTMGAVGSVIAEKALLRAPISGQVIKSNAVVGEMASPGMVLAVIADTDHLYVSSNIKEGSVMRVRIGQTVDVTVDAFRGRVFPGRIQNVGRATASTFSLLPAQNSSGNYTKVVQVVPVKIRLLDTSGAQLMVGMNAGVRIHVESTR
jgi:multidrug resistance efflux pump